ncbi:MAG TPA: methyltransferase domain-containing protein [Casimicrobiaceae bacterium]|nr:methyltransferase domain-containing protein [Casimicrobiaceae bacterium]
MAWQPAQYLQYAGERLRPAVDLLARVPLERPKNVVDLGCGAGNVTRLLGKRWPEARILGVDSSPEMLDEARAATANDSRYRFVAADLATWQPDAPVDLIYSNAALHWLPGHAALFARLAGMVVPGGVLAVQMPDNFRAPSHMTIADIARSERWRTRLGSIVREPPVSAPADYLSWLTPHMTGVDVWLTEYLQVLPPRGDGEHPVAAWTKGTWLVPIMAALDEGERAEFLREYMRRLAVAYPPRDDGSTLFPFRRLFIVANR